MKKSSSKTLSAAPGAHTGYEVILSGLVELLESARRVSARAVNTIMTATYWEVGRRIVEHEQHGKKRAGYGEALLERLSADLTARFGRGFSRQNLHKYRQFFLSYPAENIRPTLSGEFIAPGGNRRTGLANLTCTQHRQLLSIAVVRLRAPARAAQRGSEKVL